MKYTKEEIDNARDAYLKARDEWRVIANELRLHVKDYGISGVYTDKIKAVKTNKTVLSAISKKLAIDTLGEKETKSLFPSMFETTEDIIVTDIKSDKDSPANWNTSKNYTYID